MKRKILKTLAIGFGIILIAVIAAFAVLAYIAAKYIPEDESPKHVAHFIKANPERASIYLVRNGEVLADKNSESMFPLASTVKTIIAIEYARQVGAGKLDPKEKIDLSELDKFYLGGDGGAHSTWIKQFAEKGWIVESRATLEDVAKGMIWYSSNANTEYLLDRLGFDNVNRNLAELGLTHHEQLYPFVSAVILTRDFSSNELQKMSLEDYTTKSFEMHKKLKSSLIDKSPQSFITGLYRLVTDADRPWSDRLPASTTKEYASIVKKINDRNFFDAKTQTALDAVMEVYMQRPEFSETFTHIGGKGGSTAYVLTKTVYANDKSGNKTEMCVFFNDLNIFEATELQSRIFEFEKLMLTDDAFRNEMIASLNQN